MTTKKRVQIAAPQEEESDVESIEDNAASNQEAGAVVKSPSLLSKMLAFSPFRGKVASSTRSSFKRRRAQAEAQAKTKKKDIQSKISELKESLDLESNEIEAKRQQLHRKEAKLDPSHSGHVSDGMRELKKEISVLTEELEDKVHQYKVAAIRTNAKISRLEMEMATLDSLRDVELAEISEDEEQYLGSDEDLESEEERLATEFKKWKVAATGGDGDENKGQETIPVTSSAGPGPVMPPTALDSIAQSLQALTKLADSSNPQVGSVTEKMLVRQSVGRDLPPFSGRPEEWPSFIATFKRTTTACGFTDAENVERIRKCLRGSAAKSVECLLVSPQSLPKVLQILEEKYGQPEVVVHAMVTKTKAVPPVKEDKPQTMIEFGTAVVNLVAAIKNLGEDGHLKNPVLLRELVEKLPPNVRISWEESVVSAVSTSSLEDFSEWVEKRVKIACRMCPPKQFEEKKDDQKSKAKGVKDHRDEGDVPTAAGLVSGQSSKICVFCGKNNHYSSDCYKSEHMTIVEKEDIIKKNKICFKCLRIGHIAKSCKVKLNCGLCKKSGHCKPMCPELKSNQKNRFSSPAEVEEMEPSVSAATASHSCRKDILLKTLLVRVVGLKNSRVVRLIFDEGSQHSNVSSTTIENAGGRLVGEEWGRNVLFGGSVTSSTKVKKFKMELESMDGKVRKELVLRETPVICGNLPRVPHGPWIQELKKKKIWITDMEVAKVENPDIDVLIGSDYWGQLVTGKPIKLNSGLVAVKTLFGWTLSGPVPGYDSRGESAAMMSTSLLTAQYSVPEMWSLESIGIQDPIDHKSQKEKEAATQQHFLDNVSRNEDGRYKVNLPWILGAPVIPDNKKIAEKRLESTTSKLKAAGKYAEYNKIFEDWLKEGIIEQVEDDLSVKKCHYLPHRAVFKPQSVTTPVRPVFDASCKVGRNPSLNECLEKGPNLLELIPSLLLRFRQKKIGVISDIRKAFQMVEVAEEDRDFLRFLWWKDKEELVTFRHRRVVFGLNASPFLLGAVLEYHLRSVDGEDKKIAMKILKSLYVDNNVTSVDSLEEYKEFKVKSIQLLSQAGMELRQWEHSGEDSPSEELSSVLGLKWNKLEDSLGVEIPEENPEKLTKRIILSLVHKLFDPLGFLSPATLIPKLLMQKAWEKKTAWDDEIDEDMKMEFSTWWKELPILRNVSIPRFAFGELDSELEIHTFSDASKSAYAAAVFIRVKNGDNISVQLLQSKTRVAPLKLGSIPRLELLGCAIAARLTTSVKEALSLQDTTTRFWSDSSTALAWIRRNDEWGTFVGNRVKEILTLTKVEEWHFVPGKLNPADLPSRGCSPSKLVKSQWWEGPSWLKEDMDKWPSDEDIPDEEIVLNERRKGRTMKLAVMSQDQPFYYKSSHYMKNLRVFAYVKRFVDKCRHRSKESGHITQKEIAASEHTLFKIVQLEVFRSDQNVIAGLKVVRDGDGLIRLETRLLQRQDTEAFRKPVLLPNNHPVVEQLIREEHLHHHHAGVQFLLGRIRERCWIIQGRRAIRKVVRSCVVCRRFTTKSPNVPSSSLPENRVKDAKAFQIIGIDLAGPLFMKDKSKTWLVLFTCAVFRCVHLELVDSPRTTDHNLHRQRHKFRRRQQFVPAVGLEKNSREDQCHENRVEI